MDTMVEEVKLSFGRCIAAGDLIDRFYAIFLDSNPDIKPHFKDTNFTVQMAMLRQSVNLAIMFAAGSQVGHSGLDRIKKSHSKSELGIPPHLYKYWKESMIEAVSDTDPKFDHKLGAAWGKVLQLAVDHVAGDYES